MQAALETHVDELIIANFAVVCHYILFAIQICKNDLCGITDSVDMLSE